MTVTISQLASEDSKPMTREKRTSQKSSAQFSITMSQSRFKLINHFFLSISLFFQAPTQTVNRLFMSYFSIVTANTI